MPTDPTAENGNDRDTNSQSFHADDLHPSQRYEMAIQESLNIMREQLVGRELVENYSDIVHDAAFSFLNCAFHRFNKIQPAGYEYQRIGYDIDAAEISYALQRMSGGRRLATNSLRLDNILDDLIHEARLLSRSQIAQCEQCEHCIREYPNMDRSDPLTTPNSLDEPTLAWVLNDLRDSGSVTDRENGWEIVALFAHIDSMLYANRPGAIRKLIASLLEVLLHSDVNHADERAKYASRAIAHVIEIRTMCEKGDD